MKEKPKVKFRKINSQGSLVASATVPLIPEKGIWIRDWLIFNTNEKISSSPPSRKYQDNQGNTKYASYLSFDSKDLYWKWCNKIADLYKEWIEAGGIEEPVQYQQNREERFIDETVKEEQHNTVDINEDDEFKVPF
ncbi:MAG: hypothetical protein A3C43_02655 [Candidatus Schekmanbacteria bacterium RIFCSPHIGHO2_02_FULL_38_11]|uniref:Uncharacterized protein n=1 Tax=Candidatus Schekmanbacteria bacterium RIFCSPLOWO2_12_FULL_38_15 TaxID=1817883 RepID=A0A1F7SI76_9BACT|nr:MAG: hypothetical protein A2043_06395 [Candidatus Schekmanbacteria bacterium GWA2_38_9]OGL50769.1 MAG: hypothetical protein A3H37_02850 [Candidatus Schekmanbacteria bacterium RIFCSPLOWO2_02_FULL_38_14]OGL53471.1 MAG: hypothetical protein A3G31_08215 [Candidatus Schekmanbacteria bacterium RIFCSPLOWO2_12_FULL_38_15]OGL54966.1 MAG: hypothetical protein A3C43_02655 [Candidatus Schekmanbacteria bacterium RIFCSPHIGHO2_02_FULL_38_11]